MQRTLPASFRALDAESDAQLPLSLDFTAWTAALAVIGYPLAGLTSAYLGVADNTVSLLFRSFVVLLAILSFFVKGLKYGFRGIDSWLVLFLLLYTFRLLYDSGRPELEMLNVGLTYWIGATLVPLFGILLPCNGWNSRNVVTALFWVGVTACSGAFFLELLGFNLESLDNRLEFERLNPISTSHTALTTFLVIVAGRLYWQSRALRIFSLAMLPLVIYVMILGNTRSAVVALTLCLGLLSFNRSAYFAVPIVLLAVVGLWFSPLIQDEGFLRYFRFDELGQEQSSATRVGYIGESIDELIDHPLFGSGALLPDKSYPHNIFLESAVALGIPGLFLIVSLVCRTAVRAVRNIKTPECVWALLFVQYFVLAQFSGSFAGDTALFLFVAYLLGSNTVSSGTTSRIRDDRSAARLQP